MYFTCITVPKTEQSLKWTENVHKYSWVTLSQWRISVCQRSCVHFKGNERTTNWWLTASSAHSHYYSRVTYGPHARTGCCLRSRAADEAADEWRTAQTDDRASHRASQTQTTHLHTHHATTTTTISTTAAEFEAPRLISTGFESWQCYCQGRNHRGGHGGRVPRAPYHVPIYIKITTDSLSSDLTFDEWRGVILQHIIRPTLLLHVINHYTTCCF